MAKLTREEFDKRYWKDKGPENVPASTRREFYSDYRESGKSYRDYWEETTSIGEATRAARLAETALSKGEYEHALELTLAAPSVANRSVQKRLNVAYQEAVRRLSPADLRRLGRHLNPRPEQRKNPRGIYHETHKGITIYRYIKPSGYGFEEYGNPLTNSIVEARALADEHLRKEAKAYEAGKSDAQRYWDSLSADERSAYRRDQRMWDYDSVADFAYAMHQQQKSNPRPAKRQNTRIRRNGQEVAQTILKQMGGTGKLSVMIGAKDFISYPNGVAFKFMDPGAGKPNYVKIVLNARDTYDLEFGRLRGMNYKVVKSFDDIYNDSLRSLFERTTGLYLSL